MIQYIKAFSFVNNVSSRAAEIFNLLGPHQNWLPRAVFKVCKKKSIIYVYFQLFIYISLCVFGTFFLIFFGLNTILAVSLHFW